MRWIVTGVLVLAAFPALAQQPPPDPLVARLAQEWAAYQLGQQHIGETLSKLLEERAAMQKQLADERAKPPTAPEKPKTE